MLLLFFIILVVFSRYGIAKHTKSDRPDTWTHGLETEKSSKAAPHPRINRKIRSPGHVMKKNKPSGNPSRKSWIKKKNAEQNKAVEAMVVQLENEQKKSIFNKWIKKITGEHGADRKKSLTKKDEQNPHHPHTVGFPMPTEKTKSNPSPRRRSGINKRTPRGENGPDHRKSLTKKKKDHEVAHGFIAHPGNNKNFTEWNARKKYKSLHTVSKLIPNHEVYPTTTTFTEGIKVWNTKTYPIQTTTEKITTTPKMTTPTVKITTTKKVWNGKSTHGTKSGDSNDSKTKNNWTTKKSDKSTTTKKNSSGDTTTHHKSTTKKNFSGDTTTPHKSTTKKNSSGDTTTPHKSTTTKEHTTTPKKTTTTVKMTTTSPHKSTKKWHTSKDTTKPHKSTTKWHTSKETTTPHKSTTTKKHTTTPKKVWKAKSTTKWHSNKKHTSSEASNKSQPHKKSSSSSTSSEKSNTCDISACKAAYYSFVQQQQNTNQQQQQQHKHNQVFISRNSKYSHNSGNKRRRLENNQYNNEDIDQIRAEMQMLSARVYVSIAVASVSSILITLVAVFGFIHCCNLKIIKSPYSHNLNQNTNQKTPEQDI